jgi:hypothetical protein
MYVWVTTTSSSLLSRSLLLCRKKGQRKAKKKKKKKERHVKRQLKKMYKTLLIPFQSYTYDDKRQTHQNKIPRAFVLDGWQKKEDNWTLISSRCSLHWSPSAMFDLIERKFSFSTFVYFLTYITWTNVSGLIKKYILRLIVHLNQTSCLTRTLSFSIVFNTEFSEWTNTPVR